MGPQFESHGQFWWSCSHQLILPSRPPWQLWFQVDRHVTPALLRQHSASSSRLGLMMIMMMTMKTMTLLSWYFWQSDHQPSHFQIGHNYLISIIINIFITIMIMIIAIPRFPPTLCQLPKQEDPTFAPPTVDERLGMSMCIEQNFMMVIMMTFWLWSSRP